MKLDPTDRSVPTLLTGAYAVAVVLALVVAASTSGAAFDAHNAGWEGLSGVRTTADASGLDSTVVTDLGDYDRIGSDGSVVLLVAPGETTPEHRERLRSVLEGGGTVVVASQDASAANPLLSDLGTRLRIDGAPLRDERQYAATPAFPLVTDVRDHPYVRLARGSALNHGTAIGVANESAAPTDQAAWSGDGPVALANTSDYSYLDRNGNGEPDSSELLAPRAVVATERVESGGEVVVVSDPSAFINAMLDRGPNRALVAGILGEHRQLVLDRVGSDVPPLFVAIATLRGGAPLAALVGLLPILAVLGWERWPLARRLVRGDRAGASPDDASAGSSSSASGSSTVGSTRSAESSDATGSPGSWLDVRSSLAGGPDAGSSGTTRGEADVHRDRSAAPTPDPDALDAYLRREHPELDERQRERVLGGVMGVDAEARGDDR